jgi:hypothetical protein
VKHIKDVLHEMYDDDGVEKQADWLVTYKIDPIKDLRPVCPNCHSMLHQRKKPCFTIAELRVILKKN